MSQTIEVTIPDGYRAVRYGVPKAGEYFMANTQTGLIKTSDRDMASEYVVVEKIRLSLHKFYCMVTEYSKETGFDYVTSVFDILEKVRPELVRHAKNVNSKHIPWTGPNTPEFEKLVDLIEINWMPKIY